MLLHEWNMNEALAVRFDEGVAKGVDIGRTEGIDIGEARGETRVLDLMKKGYDFNQIEEILKNKELK